MENVEIGFLCGRLYERFRMECQNYLCREQIFLISAVQEVDFFISLSDRIRIESCLKHLLPYISINYVLSKNRTKITIEASRDDVIKFKFGGII